MPRLSRSDWFALLFVALGVAALAGIIAVVLRSVGG